MLNEIQTARLSEERKGGHSIGRAWPNGCEGSNLSHSGPNSRNKRSLPVWKELMWSYRESGANVIPKIFLSNTQFGFKNQNKNFELETSWDGIHLNMKEGMWENLGRRGISLAAIEKLNGWGESNHREADKKRVAVVNTRADKGMDYCNHGGCGNRFTDSSKAPELVVRGMSS